MMSSLIALAVAQTWAQGWAQPPTMRRLPQPPYRTEGVAAPPPPPPPPRPPAAPGSGQTTPARHVAGTIFADDYPASAIRAGAEGEVQTVIRVGVDGRVEACTVEGSSGNSALDLAACTIIQRRFRYRPATLSGLPVPAIVRRKVNWLLPPEEVIQFASGQVIWSQVAVNGELDQCAFTAIGPAFADMAERCGSAEAHLIDTERLPSASRLSVVNVLALIPEGEAASAPRRSDRPDFAISAALEIGPRGQILQCRVTEQVGAIPSGVQPLLDDFCADVRRKEIGFAPNQPDPRPVRRATLRQLIYVDP